MYRTPVYLNQGMHLLTPSAPAPTGPRLSSSNIGGRAHLQTMPEAQADTKEAITDALCRKAYADRAR